MRETDITIFIVDDDASVRKGLRRLVASAGFSTKTFASAQEFLAHRGSERSLLVLDVKLVGMSGIELQEQLAECGSKIPIIFITGHEDRKAYKSAMEAGAVAFLRKPFDDRVLLDAIHAGLERMNSEDLGWQKTMEKCQLGQFPG